jgi:hypothetical protein
LLLSLSAMPSGSHARCGLCAPMANSDRPTIIEKYANRRLYNTVDQHLMMCIVDTVKMMLAVSSLEISSKG